MRGCSSSFDRAVIVNAWQRHRLPSANVDLNSTGLSNLIDLVKGRCGLCKTVAYAGVKRARPFARLALSMRRPALVDIRARNPWRRARFNRLGWKVLFMSLAELKFFSESNSFMHREGGRIVRCSGLCCQFIDGLRRLWITPKRTVTLGALRNCKTPIKDHTL